MNAIETHALSRKFGDFSAVNEVTFNIPKGEIFGLLGPNGAGKTTIIRMLCGIVLPTSGSATVLGYDIRRETERIKKNIGYMSQRFSLYNDLTPRENLNVYASIYGLGRKQQKGRIDELIEMAGLKDFQKEFTRSLSGAWRQRLALACAIVHEPPMLFLDEPTAGVDPISRREFWELIYEMAGRGVSMLTTTHYMDEAEFCNTIGMMYQGKLVACASPDLLRANMPGVLLQIDCDQPEEALRFLQNPTTTEPGDVLNASLHGAQLHVTIRDASGQPALLRSLEAAGIHTLQAEAVEPTLEDVFIRTINQIRSS